MKNITLVLLIIPLVNLFSQGVGINTISPRATLHVNGDFKFVPKLITATRLVGVMAGGDVKEIALGETFNITNGTLTVTPALDPNILKIGDIDQSSEASSKTQYDDFDIGVANTNQDRAIIRITGETSGYNVTGFTGGTDGRIIYYYNAQGNNVTFFNLNVGSAAKNQIITGSGSNEGISGEGVGEFIYDGTLGKWILINIRA